MDHLGSLYLLKITLLMDVIYIRAASCKLGRSVAVMAACEAVLWLLNAVPESVGTLPFKSQTRRMWEE